MESIIRSQAIAQFIAVYTADSSKRALISLFDLVAHTHGPNATPIEQLERFTFRLTQADAVIERLTLACSQQKARIVRSMRGRPWTPPAMLSTEIWNDQKEHARVMAEHRAQIDRAPAHEQAGTRSILSTAAPKPRSPRARVTRKQLAEINAELNKLKWSKSRGKRITPSKKRKRSTHAISRK